MQQHAAAVLGAAAILITGLTATGRLHTRASELQTAASADTARVAGPSLAFEDAQQEQVSRTH